ncbi:MAG: hypothetical protein DRN18_00805 [Thermoplasmata archaeon]|nr:MAG: hypothetical protein DRN18_00805 [Thermoplasmata archaeon]
MKANRKFVEGREAVSAVIGVILMVAITVAIAAAVYIYISGILTTTPKSTPAVPLSSAPSGTDCTITVSTSEPGIKWNSTSFTFVNVSNGTSITVKYTKLNDSGSVKYYQWGNVNITLPGTEKITSGQIIKITGLGSDYSYKFTLIYNPTGGVMGTTDWTQ